MAQIDRLESDLDELADQKAEIEKARIACRDACAFALSQFARECERGGGDPDLEATLRALDDLLGDMEYDAMAKLGQEIDSISLSLGVEYRKQGVA